MEKTVRLEAQEERSMFQGNTPENLEELWPWRFVTPEALRAESLLQPVEHLGAREVEFLKRNVSAFIYGAMGWNLETSPQGGDPVIVDIVRDQSGLVSAILEWRFDRLSRAFSGGDFGFPDTIHREARAVVPIEDPEDVEYVVGRFNEVLQRHEHGIIDAGDLERALRDARLDAGSIAKRQEECLKETGLDSMTMDEKRREFTARWRAEREASRKADSNAV